MAKTVASKPENPTIDAGRAERRAWYQDANVDRRMTISPEKNRRLLQSRPVESVVGIDDVELVRDFAARVEAAPPRAGACPVGSAAESARRLGKPEYDRVSRRRWYFTNFSDWEKCQQIYKIVIRRTSDLRARLTLEVAGPRDEWRAELHRCEEISNVFLRIGTLDGWPSDSMRDLLPPKLAERYRDLKRTRNNVVQATRNQVGADLATAGLDEEIAAIVEAGRVADESVFSNITASIQNVLTWWRGLRPAGAR